MQFAGKPLKVWSPEAATAAVVAAFAIEKGCCIITLVAVVFTFVIDSSIQAMKHRFGEVEMFAIDFFHTKEELF